MSVAKSISSRKGDQFSHPVKAATKIAAGHLVVLDVTGFALEAHVAPNLIVCGMAEASVDNEEGANGAKRVNCARGTELFRFENDTADPVVRSHINGLCYILDSETVSSSHDTNARSQAGIVRDLDDTGVWVEFA